MKSTAKLKKDLDAIFSKYIRWKYAIDGICKCYTCGKLAPVKNIQNGHFIPRNILITRFDERNCRPQCVGCNLYGNGKVFDFEERLKKELGEKEVEKLKQSRHKVFKIDSIWYQEKIAHYKELVKQYEM